MSTRPAGPDPRVDPRPDPRVGSGRVQGVGPAGPARVKTRVERYYLVIL